MVETVAKSMGEGPKLGISGVDELVGVAQILLQSIPEDRKQQWAGRVMVHLAKETIRHASEGGAPKISTKAIHSDLGGNPNQGPSAWLSPLWKEIEQRYYPEIEEALIERCREAGLSVYPVLVKEEGKPAYYWLALKEIPRSASEADPVLHRTHTRPSVVSYKKDLTLRLSSAGRFFFSGGMKWTPLRRYSYLTWQLLFLISAAIFACLIWFILWRRQGALSAQDLVLLAMGFGFPLWAYHHIESVFQLFEDRIIIAPEWMLAWKEFGATIEITRSKNPEMPSEIHVNRYSATCPVCESMVKLAKGEPDFPRRVVGRCEENPREHVFSFDRSTKCGLPLRAMSITADGVSRSDS